MQHAGRPDGRYLPDGAVHQHASGRRRGNAPFSPRTGMIDERMHCFEIYCYFIIARFAVYQPTFTARE
jgi:hypothetical protein